MQQEPENYRINLDLFEGPLDLLLYLIKKNDLSISDIPITLILDQYMKFIDLMQNLDIDVAGEFIVMASELTHIKSRLLLRQENEEEEEPDPRADLVARLTEYQKYKRAAGWLGVRPMLSKDFFKRPEAPLPEEFEPEEDMLEVEPFALTTAFRNILKRAPRDTAHEVTAERISVTERIYQILDRFQGDESLAFEELFTTDMTRSGVVVTFLALLEMAKLKMLMIYQTDRFGAIRVKKKIEVLPEKIAIEGDETIH